jgi:hypothetical protein
MGRRDKEDSMTASDRKALAAMVAEAVAAALAAQNPAEDDTAEVVAVTTPRKRRSQSPKSAPKGTAARRKRGEKATEWVVRESWKGEQASTRMLGFAVKQGVPAAILKRGDKFEVSQSCGQKLGLPVVIRD